MIQTYNLLQVNLPDGTPIVVISFMAVKFFLISGTCYFTFGTAAKIKDIFYRRSL